MSDSDDRPAFERGTGFLLARLASLAARSWAAFLTGRGLTQGQYAILVTIKEQGPVGQRRLADLVAVDARNVVTVIDALEAGGLIQRQAHDTDRRRRIITLTDAGTTLTDALATSASDQQDRFLHALTPRERTHLNHLLQKLYTSHTLSPDAATAGDHPPE